MTGMVNGQHVDGGQRLEARVVGHVQGVGFRWFVNRVAARLGLVGWVANESDGSVRVVAQGGEQELGQLVGALREGPAGSRVERVELSERLPPDRSLTRFQIRAGSHRGD